MEISSIWKTGAFQLPFAAGKLEKRFSHGLSMLVSYTWGKALTDAVDHLATSGAGNGVDVGVFREPQDGYNRAAQYGPAEFDVTHRFVASAIWQFPYGRGRQFGGVPTGVSSSSLAVEILPDYLCPDGPRTHGEPGAIAEPGRRAAQPSKPYRRWNAADRSADCGSMVRPDAL